MLNKIQIDQLVGRITGAIPDSLMPTATAAKQNLNTIMHTAIANLDLVTRDEFDAQVAVLQHTRMRLESLEQQINELEQLIHRPDS
jgi:BMFP domain-containing protein YqiC